MHIVHITSVHVVDDVRILKKQCTSLSRMGIKTSLLVRHSREETIDGVIIKPLLIIKNRFLRMLRAIYPTIRIALKENGNLYHLHDPELLITGQCLRLFGKKVIFDMHENLRTDIGAKHYIPAFIRPVIAALWKISERILFYKIPVIFAESSFKKDYEWMMDTVDILNMPITETIFRIKVPKKHVFTMVYCGEISVDRGTLVMLRIIQILKERDISVKLFCVGRDATSHFKNAIKQYGVDDRVQYIDRVSPENAWKMTAACHIGLALIQPEPKNIGTFFTKIPEYMALGLPVIASDFPVIKQVIETSECGICVDPRRPEEAVDAIEYLFHNPSICKKMGERGRETTIGEFNWKNEEKKLITFYNRVLG